MKTAGEKARRVGRKSSSGAGIEIPDEREICQILSLYVRDLPQHLPSMIRKHLEVLMAWNRKIALTSLASPHDIVRILFGESFFGIQVAGVSRGLAVDVGSGAGFPGIPAAMMQPELHVILLESSVKKAAFLHEVLRRVELGDRCEVFRGRFEQWDPAEAPADWVLSRAVAVDRRFLAHAREVLRPGGHIVLWTTTGLAQKISSKSSSGWKWGGEHPIPGAERRCVVVGLRSEG